MSSKKTAPLNIDAVFFLVVCFKRGSEDAYATARTVTEMAQRLNTRLARQSSDSYHQGAVGGAEAVNRRRPSRHSSLYQ